MQTTKLHKEKTSNVLLLRGVTKILKCGTVETKAIDNIDISINKGDFVSLEGPSGSGKSTLLSILALLDEPDSGEFHLSGVNVSDISFKERLRVRNKYIGVVFQAYNLIPTMTVLENTILPLTFYKTCSKDDAKIKAITILTNVGLKDKIFHRPDQLSGGQQQRAAIARALITDPEILLADEATGNLDSENARNVIELFKELNKNGQTILMITHDKSLANLAKIQLHMLDGKITTNSQSI